MPKEAIVTGGDDERKREQAQHQRAQAPQRDKRVTSSVLEANDDRQPAHHDDAGGDRAGMDQAELEAVAREEVSSGDPEPDPEWSVAGTERDDERAE